jgi:hypothetical protein
MKPLLQSTLLKDPNQTDLKISFSLHFLLSLLPPPPKEILGGGKEVNSSSFYQELPPPSTGNGR